MPESYGGAWQEFRATIAITLLHLAMWVHFRATMDASEGLTRIREAKRRA